MPNFAQTIAMTPKKNIIIIGGGAAGFFCAANLNPEHYNIRILEQNAEVLSKVRISGGGRCNVTHACFDPKDLVKFYPRGAKELLGVFHQFQPGDTMAWFEERGVALNIEEDNRIFPSSNRSQSIIDALLAAAAENQVKINTQVAVQDLSFDGERYHIQTKTGPFEADVVIFCTGSQPKSLKILEKLNHQLVAQVPSLFTFNIKHPMLEDMMGTSFEMASVKIPELKLEEEGPMLITHWGLSGPAILKLSAWSAIALQEKQYRSPLLVNFINQTPEDAEEIFLENKQTHSKKQIAQVKMFGLTQRFWLKTLACAQVPADKQMANIKQSEMRQIIEMLCQCKMQLMGKTTFKEEFVTAGGVALKQINFKTMESKLMPGLYFGGEVLNIDAITGGFNFQACWSEAWLIAQHLNVLEG
jgi:predicted Rossmann fold flavoprotein